MKARELAAGLAAALIVAGCSKQESEPADAPEAAAPAAESATVAAAPPAGAPDQDAGATAYRTYCVSCHGDAGRGDGPAAAALSPKPADFSAGAFKYDANGNGVKGELEDIQAIVRDGAARYGGSPLMAPWPMLTAEQRQAVAQHVKSLRAG